VSDRAPHASPTATRTAFIGLGSNLGDRRAFLLDALAALDAHPGISVEAISTIIETPPVGPPPQGPYLNACARLATSLEPRPLLEAMLGIERDLGRDRACERRWGPRTLDLDLLIFAEWCVDEPGLTIPHPRLHERGFVLQPLAQIAGSVIVPGHGRTVAALAERLRADATHGSPDAPDILSQ